MTVAAGTATDRGLRPILHSLLTPAGLLMFNGIVAGVAIRWFIYASALGQPNSDEVIAGLMARHLADDGYPAFFWGQQYGGTLQLSPVWVASKLFGEGLFALRLPNVVLAILNPFLLYRLSRRWTSETTARLAALLLWVGPAATTLFNIHEQLFYPVTVTLGLATALAACRLGDREASGWAVSGWTALVGLGLGVGWWTTLTSVIAAPVALACLVATTRRSGVALLGRRGAIRPSSVIAGFVGIGVGASPWIVRSLTTDWAPLHASDPFPRLGTPLTRFWYLLREGLPGALGVRNLAGHTWTGGWFGRLAWLLLALVLLRGLAHSVRRGWFDAVGLAAFSIVYAAIGWSTNDPPFRYLGNASPFLALLFARGVDGLGGSKARSTRVAAAALAVAVALTTFAAVRFESGARRNRGAIANAPPVGELVRVLERHRIDRVWADYWVAYTLTFHAEERVIAAPTYVSRYPPYEALLRSAATPAWVVVKGRQHRAYEAGLAALGATDVQIDAGDYVISVPDRNVLPEQMPEQARVNLLYDEPTLD